MFMYTYSCIYVGICVYICVCVCIYREANNENNKKDFEKVRQISTLFSEISWTSESDSELLPCLFHTKNVYIHIYMYMYKYIYLCT